ncbi:MAG: regulator of chromosome condensation, partial [Ilumatobacteraceae bacterium]|nr:regulator of chromosome condensation [Ilumatobacteraceae bacterium]
MLRKFSSAVVGLTLVTTVAVVGAVPPQMASAALITSDDFTSGTLASWTDVTRATIDTTIGSPAAPSMRVAATAQSAYARISLAAPAMQACVSVNVNLATNAATGTDLFRLRTAANGALMRVFVAANGTVQLRNDTNASTSPTTVELGAGWHNLELCGTIGTATSWTLYDDGVLINTLATDTGATPIGLVQLGDTAAKTFVANFDHLVVDQAPGDQAAGPPDTTAPTVPGRPTGASASSSSIQLSWAASTDASASISYRVYRDGGATAVGTVAALSFTDTGLTPGSSHTYTVDAVDPSGNVSAKSTASASITVQTAQADTTPPTVPGRPTGTSPSPGTIVISWAASTDASAPVGYRVYRDGVAAQIATVTALTFTDTGLATGSSHTYNVDAI